jgi:hypothetical protein
MVHKRRLYTIADVCTLFGCHRNSVRKIRGLSACEVDTGLRAVRFDADAVDELLTSRASKKRNARAAA